jgi:hypothetical protein
MNLTNIEASEGVMHRNILVGIILFSLAIIALDSCSPAPSTKSEYVDEEYNVRFSYPKGFSLARYQRNDDNDIIDFFMIFRTGESLRHDHEGYADNAIVIGKAKAINFYQRLFKHHNTTYLDKKLNLSRSDGSHNYYINIMLSDNDIWLIIAPQYPDYVSPENEIFAKESDVEPIIRKHVQKEYADALLEILKTMKLNKPVSPSATTPSSDKTPATSSQNGGNQLDAENADEKSAVQKENQPRPEKSQPQ